MWKFILNKQVLGKFRETKVYIYCCLVIGQSLDEINVKIRSLAFS